MAHHAHSPLSPQEKQNIFGELKEKFSGDPMVHIIRRLVVALDQTGIGSEERKKTQNILEILSGQQEISSDSSRWLDWLEEQPEGEPTWEDAEERIFAGSKPAEGKRVTVEIPEDPVSSGEGARVAITKEQQIWDRALKRSEKMRNRKGRPLQLLLTLLVIIALGYLLHRSMPTLKVWVADLRNPDLKKGFEVETLWGNYQRRLQEVPQKELLAHLTGLPDLVLPTPIQHRDLLEPSLALLDWGRLTLQEMLFSEWEEGVVRGSLDPKSLEPGVREWEIERRDSRAGKTRVRFREEVEIRGARALVSIQRNHDGNGSAHKVMLDEKGVMAWTWKLVREGQSLEGSLFRKSGPDRIEWSGKMWGGKRWKGSRKFPSDQVVLPAIWSPSFLPFHKFPILHPMGGRVSSGEMFWGDTQLKPETKEGFEVYSAYEDWMERWDLSGGSEHRP